MTDITARARASAANPLLPAPTDRRPTASALADVPTRALDGHAAILDVEQPRLLGDLPSLGGLEAKLEPQRLGAGAHGLTGMRYRVEAEGGRLRIDASPGRGTCIEAWLPAAAAS